MRKILVLGLAAAAAVAVFAGREQTAKLPDHFVNRVWIDHVPVSPRDKIEAFVLQGEPRIGAFQKTSMYEGDFQLFEWAEGEKGVKMRMLQNESKHKVGVAVKHGCKPFDYCLTLSGAPRGPREYVSMEDWVIESGEELTAERVRALIQE